MTREKKLEAIYKEMADTDIDEWCIIEAYGERWTILDYNWTRAYVWRQRWDFEKFDDYQHLSIKFWYKVIWRPVMIWDVLEYSSRILVSWDPILMQRDDFRKRIVKNALKTGKKEQNFTLMMFNLRKAIFSMFFL